MESSLLDQLMVFAKKDQEPPAVEVCSEDKQSSFDLNSLVEKIWKISAFPISGLALLGTRGPLSPESLMNRIDPSPNTFKAIQSLNIFKAHLDLRAPICNACIDINHIPERVASTGLPFKGIIGGIIVGGICFQIYRYFKYQEIENQAEKIEEFDVLISHERNIYPLNMETFSTVQSLKAALSKRNCCSVQETVFLHGGRVLLDEEKALAEYGIAKNSKIIAVPTSCGGDCLRFMQTILDTVIEDLEHFKSSLDFLNKQTRLANFIYPALQMIQDKKVNNQNLSNTPEIELLAIMLWTSDILFRELNQSLRSNGDFSSWNVYLKHLVTGLKSMPYHQGKVYRGYDQVRDLDKYKKGKLVNWKTVSALSKDKKVAENFSSKNGMIFEVDVFSSRNISSFSIYSKEEEVLLLPYSRLEVVDVIETPGEPVYIRLREIPIPRAPKVVFWVDDNPENNLEIAKEVEDQGISCVFCVSTKDALRVIESYQWVLLLQNADFRIVTDMVREEDGKMNYTAGVDLIEKLFKDYKYNFEVLIFCQDTERAKMNCEKRKLSGPFSITSDFKRVGRFLKFQEYRLQKAKNAVGSFFEK